MLRTTNACHVLYERERFLPSCQKFVTFTSSHPLLSDSLQIKSTSAHTSHQVIHNVMSMATIGFSPFISVSRDFFPTNNKTCVCVCKRVKQNMSGGEGEKWTEIL